MDQSLVEGTLTLDIYSSVTKRTKETIPFGKKGDKVKVISDNGNVMIVEGKKGNRFTVESDSIEIKTQK